MKTNNGTKKNIVRLVAMLLIVVGVLTALPASAFAGWTYKVFSLKSDPVQGTQGDITVNYKAFSQDIYIAEKGSTKYYTSEDRQTELSEAEIKTLKESAHNQQTQVASQTKNATTSNYYSASCTGANNKPQTLNFSFDTPTFSVTTSQGETSIIVGSVTTQYTTPELTSTSVSTAPTIGQPGVAEVYPIPISTTTLSDGSVEKVYVDVYYCWDASDVTLTVTQADSRNGGKVGWTNLFGLGCCNKNTQHYTYKASVKFQPNVYWVSYVRVVTVETPEEHIPFHLYSNGDTLYSVSGYSEGDAVAMPAYSAIYDSLGDMKEIARCIVGCYSSVTEKDGAYTVGAAYDLPLIIGKDISPTVTDGTKSIDIWLKISTKIDLSYNPEGKTDYSTSMSTGSIMLGASSSLTNASSITNDVSYNAEDNSFMLSVSEIKGSLQMGIAKDSATAVTNVNASSNDSKPTVSANVASTSVSGSATVPVDDNVRDFTVILQQNTTVTGLMEIGGHTGSIDYSNGSPQGLIIGNYVALDLNGHILTVASTGELRSYGYIYDSVGTGKIVVQPGGRFYTQMLIYGWTGGNSSFKSYSAGFSPFEDYNFPYVQVPVELGITSKGVGRMVGYTILYAASTTMGIEAIKTMHMPVFGSTTDGAMFTLSLKSGESSATCTMKTTLIEESRFKSSYQQIHNDGVDIKNNIAFDGLNVEFTPPYLEVAFSGQSVPLDFRRTRFPVSPMLDTVFCSCNVIVNQQIMIMPGSTMTIDKNSVLKLGYKVTNETPFTVTSLIENGFEIFGYGVPPLVATDSKRLAGGIFSLAYPGYGAQQVNGAKQGVAFDSDEYGGYWDVFGSASVNVYGTIEFQSGNHEEYVLSGNINASYFRVDSGDAKPWTLSNLTAVNLKSTTATSQNVALRTYGSITALGTGVEAEVRAYHYYSMPMINNGIAYVVDAGTGGTPGNYVYNGAMSGTYDVDSGLFTKKAGSETFETDGYSKYIIDARPYYGSDPDDNSLPSTDVILEFDPQIFGVTEELNTELVAASNGKQYVFYGGTYHPLSATVSAGAMSCSISGAYYKTAAVAKTLTLNEGTSRWE